MNKLIRILLIAGLFNIAVSSAATIEPKDVLENLQMALAKGNKAKVLEVLSPNVTIYESGYVERTRSEYESHHLDADIEFSKTSTRKILKQSEKKEGDMAIVLQETETKAKIDGQEMIILGTTTATLEKTNGKWLITHIHWSSRKPKQA